MYIGAPTDRSSYKNFLARALSRARLGFVYYCDLQAVLFATVTSSSGVVRGTRGQIPPPPPKWKSEEGRRRREGGEKRGEGKAKKNG